MGHGTKITKVHFQSYNRVISFKALAMISFEPKTVNYVTRLGKLYSTLVLFVLNVSITVLLMRFEF